MARERSVSPWIAMTVLTSGTFVVLVNVTIVNLALRAMSLDFGAEGITWVITAYVLAVCVSQPCTAWAAGHVGAKRVWVGAVGTFAIGSIACALAPSFAALIAARVLQGLGGGAVMPTGMAIVLDLFPREQHGRAIATYATSTMVAPALGPVVGGWLVTNVGWHWLFLANVPVALACITIGPLLLPDRVHRHRRPFDVVGLFTGCGGLALFVLGISEADRWGWRTAATVGCITIGAGSLAFFVRHALTTATPLVELRLFESRPFRLAIGAMSLVFFAQFARSIYVSLELQGLRGYSAVDVGLLFMPGAAVTAAFMQVGGALSDRLGPRSPMLMGICCTIAGMLVLGLLPFDVPVLAIAGGFCLLGAGTGLATAPAMVAGLSEMPPHLLPQGTAIRSLSNQVSQALAVAIMGAVVAARLGEHPSPAHTHAAHNTSYIVGAGCACIALLVASRLPKGRVAEQVVNAEPAPASVEEPSLALVD